MKKYTILLLILSMCGGTPDTDLDSFEEVSLEDKEVMSDAQDCLLYTSPSPRDKRQSRMPSSA